MKKCVQQVVRTEEVSGVICDEKKLTKSEEKTRHRAGWNESIRGTALVRCFGSKDSEARLRGFG